MQLISNEYRDLLQQMHASRPWGYGGDQYAKEVRILAKLVGARTILDYGCGTGSLGNHKLIVKRFHVTEYDPGVVGKAHLPKPADLVVATDVMEHIEPQFLSNVLQHLYSLSRKACYCVIATREARSILPDGRNAHLIVEPSEWWERQFKMLPWDVAMSALEGWELRMLMMKKIGSIPVSELLAKL